MRRYSWAAAVCGVLLAAGAAAQEDTAKRPCSGPEFRQLDFWVGSWDLTWTGQDGKPGRGRNVISRSLDKCVIEERFTALGGERPFAGMSVSTFDAKADAWRQTWVDNSGGYMPFTGGPSDEGFRLVLDNSADERTMRMIWKNVQRNSLDWHWQQSKDGGKTWENRWVIHYQRAE